MAKLVNIQNMRIFIVLGCRFGTLVVDTWTDTKNWKFILWIGFSLIFAKVIYWMHAYLLFIFINVLC